MAKEKEDKVLELPVNEHEFEINLIGTTTKKRYQGKFKTVCIPTLRQRSQSAILEANLNQDLATLDQSIALMHKFVATLRYRLIEFPDWWIEQGYGLDLIDDNITLELWKIMSEAEINWHKKVHPEVETKNKDVMKIEVTEL